LFTTRESDGEKLSLASVYMCVKVNLYTVHIIGIHYILYRYQCVYGILLYCIYLYKVLHIYTLQDVGSRVSRVYAYTYICIYIYI